MPSPRSLALALLVPLIGLLAACASSAAPTPASSVAEEPPAAASRRATDAFAVVGVTLWDGTGAPPRANATVVVEAGRVAAVGGADEVAVPEGVRKVDGRGRYLIPGLWDTHVHLGTVDTASTLLYVANGVTGVREMGSDLDLALAVRDAIARGERLGPRVVTAGAILDDAPADWPFRLPAGDAETARASVAELDRRGVDFLKVHNQVPLPAYLAIVQEAEARGLAIAGHPPIRVPLAQVIASGQRSLEHLGEFRLLGECGTGAVGDDLPDYDALCAGLFARLHERSVWQVPTLVALRSIASLGDAAVEDDPLHRYVPESLRTFWQEVIDSGGMPTPERRAIVRHLYGQALAYVGALHRAGVPIAAGTDVGVPGVVPGFSLHDELGLLAEAGLEPAAVLRAATAGAADLAGAGAETGTVEAGKVADLLLLEADPLADVGNTRRIAAVAVAGRLLERPELDALLAEAAAAAAATLE